MKFEFIPTPLEGVYIIEPERLGDSRGWFSEVWSREAFAASVRPVEFVQENESFSVRGVIRGLHYQLPPYSQGKLLRVLGGRIVDVAVDMRRGSPTFGRHVAVELSNENRRQLFIPRGFAHGFSVLSDTAHICYKCDEVYAPDHEAGLRFDDPAVGIDWRIPASEAVVSPKDALLPDLTAAEAFEYGVDLY